MVGLFANSSRMIGPKGLKFLGFDGSHPGVVIRKFGEEQSRILHVGLFFSLKYPGCDQNSMPE